MLSSGSDSLEHQKIKKSNLNKTKAKWNAEGPARRSPLGRWKQKRLKNSRRRGFPRPACQVRYLSASNRGTGDDGQHLLSQPNYLLSTEKNRRSPGPTHRFSLNGDLTMYGNVRAPNLGRRRCQVFFFNFCPAAHDSCDGPGAPGLPREAFGSGVGGADVLRVRIGKSPLMTLIHQKTKTKLSLGHEDRKCHTLAARPTQSEPLDIPVTTFSLQHLFF